MYVERRDLCGKAALKASSELALPSSAICYRREGLSTARDESVFYETELDTLPSSVKVVAWSVRELEIFNMPPLFPLSLAVVRTCGNFVEWLADERESRPLVPCLVVVPFRPLLLLLEQNPFLLEFNRTLPVYFCGRTGSQSPFCFVL